MTEEEVEEEIARIKRDRIRLKCTNKGCQMNKGFWTSPKDKEAYLEMLVCKMCESKHSMAFRLVEDET